MTDKKTGQTFLKDLTKSSLKEIRQLANDIPELSIRLPPVDDVLQHTDAVARDHMRLNYFVARMVDQHQMLVLSRHSSRHEAKKAILISLGEANAAAAITGGVTEKVYANAVATQTRVYKYVFPIKVGELLEPSRLTDAKLVISGEAGELEKLFEEQRELASRRPYTRRRIFEILGEWELLRRKIKEAAVERRSNKFDGAAFALKSFTVEGKDVRAVMRCSDGLSDPWSETIVIPIDVLGD